MRSLTSGNEGALPTLTRGRPRVTDASQNVTLGVTCHEAEAGKESPANIVTRTESGLMFADNKDITEDDSRRVWMWIFYVWEILCLPVGKLKYFPIHPKRLWQLVKYWVEMFIFHFISSGRDDMCYASSEEAADPCHTWVVSGPSHVITGDWSPHDHSDVGCRPQFIVV